MGRTGGRAARGALAVIAVAVLGVVLFLLLRTETADDTGPRDAEPAATAQGAPRGGRVTPPVAVAEPIRLEVSGPDGRPVAGAVAHRTERLADDRRTPWDSLAHGAAASGTAPLATTDAAGRAEIAVDGDAPVPLRVSAAGYEPALVSAMRGTNAVRLARGWRVRGVVLDERRAGVPGALVAAVELREGLDDVADGRARFVTTGADGRFETDAVASGQYVIFAGREPSLVGQAASVVVAADVELTLTLGAADLTLRGQVSDAEDGAPIPGARVEAQLIGPRGSFLRTAVARVDGSFVLEQLETAFVHRVRVRADGYAEVGRRWGGVAESPPRTGDGRNLSLAMQRAATIQGRVLLGGAPAPGVEVSVWERRSGAFEWSRRVATSGSDGRYEVPGVEPGTCVVDVHAAGLRRVSRPPPGYRSASRADRSWGLAVVDVRPGSKTEHDVEVVATQRCVITVVAPDKTPVVGAVVEPARGSDERAAPGRTDASGEIAVELLDDGQAGPEGAFRVTAPGFRRQAVTVSAAQRHTVTLEAGWTVTGRVERDRAGAPDAVVRAVSGSAARHPLAHRWEMGAFEPIEARAGPDGRFELRGVPMREFVIVALGADRVVGCSELIAPREGHALPEVVVKITPLRVRGRVHGATGPVAGAAIYSVERSAVSSTRWWAGVWIDWTPGGTRTPAQTFSGPDGAFEFAVPAGVEHVVWASDGTTLSGSVTLPAAGRGGTTDIELQVSADEGIHGVVSTEGGAPVAGVSVRLLKLATSAADAGAIHSAITGPDGTFRFPGVQGEW